MTVFKVAILGGCVGLAVSALTPDLSQWRRLAAIAAISVVVVILAESR